MDQIWHMLESPGIGYGTFHPEVVLLSLLLAFVLGQVLAWVYYFTHSGLSYSKSFVQSLILITIVVAMVMTVIANSIVTAVGLMGALAIVRFRNMIKDTRDIAFIFCALVAGMATGSQHYATAIIGTAVLSLITIYLFLSDFGRHYPHNGFLRFSAASHITPDHPVCDVLKRFCSASVLISAQDNDFGNSTVEYAYQLMVKNSNRNEQMLVELSGIEGVTNVSLTMQEQLLEV